MKQPETNCYPPIQGPPDIINGGLKLQTKSINPMTGQAIQFPTHIQSGLIGNQVGYAYYLIFVNRNSV